MTSDGDANEARPLLVVGESVADVVRPSHGPAVTHAGGSPANVAYGLARLGHAVTLVTELADDPDGHLIRSHLSAAGVDLRAGRPRSDRTPRATAVLDDAGSADYDFDVAWSLRAVDLPAASRHVHTGSLAVLLEPGATSVGDLLHSARHQATISLDPNLRPSLVDDRRAARERVESLARLADVVKASDEDLSWLYPGDDLGAVARHLVAGGSSLVVLTRGAAGARAFTEHLEVDVAAPSTVVVDTVGAGDSFMAAMLHALAELDLLGPAARSRLAGLGEGVVAHVLETAARAAAITVARSGAHPPTIDELIAAAPAR